MKFIHYTFLLLSCFAIGCFAPSNLSQPAPSPPKLPKPAPSPVKFQFEEGSTVLRKDYYRTLEQTKDGLYVYKVYYPSTSIITLKSTYKDKELKILHGKQIERYDSGEIWTEATYVNGLAQGYCKIGHSTDGSSFSEGMMKDGEKDGKWINTKDAVKVREMYYEDGTLHGKYTTWSETGELLAEAIYEDGAKISEEVYKEDEEIELFRIVDKMPLYGEECHKLEDAKAAKKCGDKALLTQIYRSIKYPSTAVKNNIEGTAIIKFVIEKDGSLTDIEILQGICDEIKAECLRIMNTLDKWQPGEIKGEPVRVQFNLPIRFRLE